MFVFVKVQAAPEAADLGKMMEEMSVPMHYDAQDMDLMSEEEILACLVDETDSKFTVRLAVASIGSVPSHPTYVQLI